MSASPRRRPKRRLPAPHGVTAAQVIVEALYALLALGSVVLFGLRQLPETPDFMTPEVMRLVVRLDWTVCALFFTKAVWDLCRAPNRKRWWKWGWTDFVASIPISDVAFLRAFRAARLVLVIRVFRSTIKSVAGISALFRFDRARSVGALVFSLILVSLMVSSVLVLGLEAGQPGANIRTAEDAMWWSVSTMFGIEPENFDGLRVVTTEGRLIALWLVVVAFGLLGSLAGLIWSWIEGDHDALDTAPESAPSPRAGGRKPGRARGRRPAPAGGRAANRPRSLRQSGS